MKTSSKVDPNAEVRALRQQQAEAVMPLIGPLLDAWDDLALDLRGDPELARVATYMDKINSAVEQ